MTPRRRPTRPEIERAIDERLDTPRLALRDLAEAFECSVSTVQRACAPDSFTEVLNARRARRAANAIIGGHTVSAAARLTGVSPDHLTTIFGQAYGVRPGDLRRTSLYRVTISDWLKRVVPDPSSRLYHHRRKRWLEFEAHFDAVLARAKPGTELARWLVGLEPDIRRPDYRSKQHRKFGAPARRRIQHERRRLAAQRASALLQPSDPFGAAAPYDTPLPPAFQPQSQS